MVSLLEREFLDRTEDVKSIVRCLLPLLETLDSQQFNDGQRVEELDEQMDVDVDSTAANASPLKTSKAVIERGGRLATSPSSFSSASRRKGFKWQAEHCAVLCFAHHLSIAIRDGFKAMGIKFAAQMKVIPIPKLVEPKGRRSARDLEDFWPAADPSARMRGPHPVPACNEALRSFPTDDSDVTELRSFKIALVILRLSY
ncbi:hypothetical protein CF327_g5213 [Tilletia walkeri]|nr:hypothetical protein CF327_g5213 [Tilletia walkeri]